MRHVAPKARFAGATALVAALLAAGGCEQDRPAPVASTCGAEDTSSACLLAAARSSLDAVASDVDWVAATTEYAEALSAAGSKGEADAILGVAEGRAEAIEDAKASATALVELGTAFMHNGTYPEALRIAALAESLLPGLDSEDTRANLGGKLLSLRAGAGDLASALAIALELPEEGANQASFKARTLGEIAVHQAEAGDFDQVVETLDAITMGLAYYQSTARSEVASLALAAGHDDLAPAMLREAEAIARAQDNGYFVSGAVRDIAVVYALNGDHARSQALFDTAKEGARTAASAQEKARALSRIATKLADCRQYERAVEIFPEATALARGEEAEAMRHYALYEIAGSAAFAGDFEAAFALLDDVPAAPFASAASLASATRRDIAWGLTRHGRLEEALDLANAIETARERVQALSRMVRLQEDPEMKALPRYL